MLHQAGHGGRTDSERRAAELRSLRESLYRPDPPDDAIERYRALVAQVQDGRAPAAPPDPSSRFTAAAEPAEEHAATDIRRPGRATRRVLVLAGAVGVVLLTIAALLQSAAAGGPTLAEPVVPGGPTAVVDRGVLARVLHPGYTSSDALVAAVRHSDLPQLAQWRTRAAGATVMQGTGPVVRHYGSGTSSSRPPRPFSLLVVCDRPTRYRWSVRGSTPADGEDHLLASAASDRCGGTPTAAGFTLPEGAVVHRFALSVPKGRSWGMVFVYPLG